MALKKAWQAIARIALKALLFLARILPLRVLLPFGASLGMLGYFVSRRYRRVGMNNLKLAYGEEMNEAQRRSTLQAVFRNFGKAVVEFPYVAAMPVGSVRRLALLDAEDRLRLDNALAKGKGLIAFSAHLGNFELMARRFTAEGYRFTVVVRNLDNQSFSQVVNDIRSGGGYNVIGRGEAARPILKHLKSGGVIGMLPDQNSDDMFVPFFGRLTGTVAGPAVLALRTGAPLVPMFCIRQPDNTHKVEVGDPIDTGSTGDAEADASRIMAQINTVIEAKIRQYPDQWLWIHNRWKAVPSPDVVAQWEAGGRVSSSVC